MGCGASSQNVGAANPPLNQPAITNQLSTKEYKYGRAITKRELHTLREDFWSSRSEGEPVVWQSIKSACEALLEGDFDLANAIIEASDLKADAYESLERVYDMRGVCYNVPKYCFRVPSDLVKTGSHANLKDLKTEVLSESHAESPKELTSGTKKQLTVRINPGEYNVVMEFFLEETVGAFKMKILKYSRQEREKGEITKFTIPLCEIARQRVMFMGKELKNDLETLGKVGFDENRVVQVFLRPEHKDAK